MKSKIILLGVSAMFLIGCTVQNVRTFRQQVKSPQYKDKYVEFMDTDETVVTSTYHSLFTKKADGRYVFRQFFPETKQITNLTHYAADKEIEHGLHKKWYDDGTLITEGYYLNGQKIGTWYHIGTGTGTYIDGKMEGKWESKNEKGLTKFIYQYKDGKKDGPFMVYDSLGVLTNEGVYKADTIFIQSNIDDSAKLTQIPLFSPCEGLSGKEAKDCSNSKLLMYVYKNLKYPSIAVENHIQGQVIAQFYVESDGQVTEIKINNGLCQAMKDEVTRVIKSMPRWSPAIKDGKPVRFLYTLPVKFKLEG